jgi:16S rRNA (cytosine1402-N4)-methyltransferase
MSTDQLYEERGFSFSDQGAFDMRMNETDGITAAEFVNGASERELYLALVKGGVGKNAKQIGHAIQRARPITTAKELGEVIRQSQLGKRGESKSHPATVVFQAIRIHINREREEIEDLLEAAPHLVKPGRRLAIITFHSLEDRIVTGRLREWESAGTFPASWRGPREGRQLGHLTTRKPIVPSDEEIDRNPASRSARLRVFEFM